MVDLIEKYEELESEYASLDEAFGELEQERDAAFTQVFELQEEYGRLLSQLQWTHAMLSILVEEQGGVVQVSKAVLESYPLDGAVKVYEDVEGETYIIEVAFEEEDEK